MNDLITMDKFRLEPNMTLLLNTWLTAATRSSSGAITAVTCENQLTQERFTVTGSVFIDCTGDGRLLAACGGRRVGGGGG